MLTHEKLNIPREITVENHVFAINLVENLIENPYEPLHLQLRSKSTPQCMNIAISKLELRSNKVDTVNFKLNTALNELKETLSSVHFEL
jgi:hypothetical protein